MLTNAAVHIGVNASAQTFFLSSSSLAVLKVILPVSQVAVPSGVVEDIVWSVGGPVIPPCETGFWCLSSSI